MGEEHGLARRELLIRGAAAGGAFAGLWALPRAVQQAYGDPIPIPPGARNVEAGLTAFAAKWEVAGPVVRLTRFGPYLSDKIFNCRVAGTPRAYVLRLGTTGATVTPGVDPFRHADMAMAEADWLGLLYGDFTGLGALIEGAVFPARDGANKVALLGIVMYLFAHIPAGAKSDPDLMLRVIQGVGERGGLPSCEGEPETIEDPQPQLEATLNPGATAPPVTRTLAEFFANTSYSDLPAGCVEQAKEQLKSIIGAMYAGSRMPPGRHFARAVRGFGDRGEATVLGRRPFRTSVRHAALLNSVYAQVLEWEDWTFIAHSGASIVPTALAAAEVSGASGRDLIAAIVAGNEVLARSGEVLTDVIHTGNAVPTHQLETPLIAGKLLGLGADQLQDALGIACTQPQVTSIPAWSADAKGLLSGWPVMTGVEAALFAKAGVTGRRDIVENPAGYAMRVSDVPYPERLGLLIDGLGKTWRFDKKLNQLVTKRYPTDGFQLTSVQAVLDIVGNKAKQVFDSTPRDQLPKLVKRVEVRIPWVMGASATMFAKGGPDLYKRIRERPDWTYIALLFDGKYPVAASLVNRRLSWREYEDDAIFDPVLQAIVPKIDLIPDITMGVFGAEARLELNDGRVFTSSQPCINDFDVGEKLHVGAEGILSKRKIKRILHAIDHIEDFRHVGDFMKVAAGG